jgi:hypothetical protein
MFFTINDDQDGPCKMKNSVIRTRMMAVKHLSIYGFAILLAILVCSVSWPGFMSFDPLFILKQARYGITSISHPLISIYVQFICDKIYPGPGLVFLLQNTVYMLAWAHLLTLESVSLMLGLPILIIIICCPPILGPMLVVWKDVATMAFFLGAVSLLVHAEKKKSTMALVTSFACIFIGTAYRYNAILAAIPLLLWWSTLFLQRFDQRFRSERVAVLLTKKIAIIITFTLIVLFSISLYFINSYRLPDGKRLHGNVVTNTMIFDLIGTSKFSGEILIPKGYYAEYTNFSATDLAQLYFPCNMFFSFQQNLSQQGLKPLNIKAKISANEVQRIWKKEIPKHLIAYLKHRLACMKEFLAIGRDEVYYPTNGGIDPNNLGVSFKGSWLVGPTMAWIMWAARTPLSYPWVYFAWSLVLLAWLIVKKPDGYYRPLLCLLSAQLLFVSMLSSAGSVDLRYHAWSLAAILAATFMSACIYIRQKHMTDDQLVSSLC